MVLSSICLPHVTLGKPLTLLNFSFPIFKMFISKTVLRIRGKAFKVAHSRCFVSFTCWRPVFREKGFVGHTGLHTGDC